MLHWLLILIWLVAGLLSSLLRDDVTAAQLFSGDIKFVHDETLGVAFSENITPVPVEIDQERYDEGVAIYLSSYCGTCHLLDAAGTYGNFGPAHNQSATAAATYIASDDYTGEAATVEDYIRESIVNPKAYFTPGYAVSNHAMPAYTNLTEEQLDAVVYMLAQQR